MSAYRSVAVMIVAVWFIQLAGGLLGVVTPVALGEMGVSADGIGVIAAIYSAGFMAGALASPGLISRIGNIRAFAIAATIGAVAAHLMHVLQDPLAWTAFRLAQGAAFALMFAAIESWMGEIVPSRNRGGVMGIYHLVAKAALLLGPFLIFGAAALSVLPYTLISLALSAGLIAVCLTRQPVPPPPDEPPGNPLSLGRVSIAATFIVFMTGVVNTGALALIPVYVAGLDWPGSNPTQSAIIALAVANLGGLIVQWPVGALSDKLPRRLVMAGLMFFGAAAAAGLFFSGGRLGQTATLVLIGLWGAGSLSVYGIAVAHGLDRARQSIMTALMSALLFFWAAGSVIGPVIFGFVMTELGAASLFAMLAGLMVLMGGLLLVRIGLRAPPSADAQEDWVPVGAASTAISLMDPRTPDA